MTRPKYISVNGRLVNARETLEERALRLCEQHLPKGSKEAAYVLRIISTKARNAAKREPARQARLAAKQKRNALLKAAGEEPTAKTRKSVLRDADMWFSRFIRLVHSHNKEACVCVTCNVLKPIKDIDCGHWRRRENWATRFNEMNSHPQCVRCNKHKGGEELKHEAYVRMKYGNGNADRLIVLSSAKYQRRPSNEELEAIARKYESQVTMLGGWPE